jgi:hypothetical protein
MRSSVDVPTDPVAPKMLIERGSAHGGGTIRPGESVSGRDMECLS